jgi:hypothetical protein
MPNTSTLPRLAKAIRLATNAFSVSLGSPNAFPSSLRRASALSSPLCRAIAGARCFRTTHLRKQNVPPDLERFWMGHHDEEIADRYSKLKLDVAFRQEVTLRIGLGFELPVENGVIGPNGLRSSMNG